jgi:2-dehydro-3-deoxyphosphogluconate aldolase/(4S)-4-hydroxy-2-oxoglutarate aldolase
MSEAERVVEAIAAARIVPVITIEEAAAAAPLAAALERGGLSVVEVTLRTAQGLEALREMKHAVPTLVVGAGTLRTPADVEAAVEHGAEFLVTPATTPPLERALLDSGRVGVPGVATPSEALARAEAGFTLLKLFPAEAVGGRRLLRSLAGPLPALRFMPTGGIDPENAGDYLALPNVVAIGGSWIAEPAAIRAGRWDEIEARARAAAELGVVARSA